VHSVSVSVSIRQIKIHTADPLLTDTIAKLRKFKSLDSDQILAEVIQAGGKILILWSEIHKLFHSIWDKEELPDQWMESITVPIYR
jgi:hypothetical protein